MCWRGLPIGGQSGSADHANLQYRRDEPSSLRDQQPIAADAHAVVILDGPVGTAAGARGARQYHFVGAAAVQPGAQSGRADWHYLRSHWLANSVFSSLADIMDACEMAWNRFANNHGLVRSLCAVAWASASPAL